LRREIIEQLMCNMEVDLAEIAAAHHKSLDDFKTQLSALDSLAEHGLVQRCNSVITVPEQARTLVRNVCAVFDTYLSNEELRHSRAV
jgi:oxygen-independent coproporphyrinogen-3 oxidase